MAQIRVRNYVLSKDTILMVKNILTDSVKVRLLGIPKIKAKNHIDLAQKVLRTNLKDNLLLSGAGHYKYMWISDLGIAFEGAKNVFPKKTLQSTLEHILDLSLRNGKIFSCYSYTRGADIPWKRTDSLPWLIYCFCKFHNLKGIKPLKKYMPLLQNLILDFERENLDSNGMIKSNLTGDWMDTIKRPSSTWSNICVLKMLTLARNMDFKTKFDPKELEKSLLTNRFKKNYLTDYLGSQQLSVDAIVLALYFEMFPKRIRRILAKSLKKLDIFNPCPIKPSIINYPSSFKPFLTKITANSFHQTATWLHLGLMYLNGLKKLGIGDKSGIKKINEILSKHSNILETVDSGGKSLQTILTSEYGFTMTAGQYLEYINLTVNKRLTKITHTWQ